MSAAPLPIELRLRALEARVLGVPRSQLARLNLQDDDGDESDADVQLLKLKRSSKTAPSPKEDEPQATIARRVAALEARMTEVGDANSALRQFCDNYDRYAPLLALPTDPSSEKDKDGNVKEPTAEVVHARDLLPEAQQAAMVLEARADIIDAERGLREIDVLAKRGVAGAEGLEDIVELKPALHAGAERVSTRSKNLGEARAQAATLVERYTEFTTTVSDMFLALHEQLAAMEEAVTRAERAKRADIAQRF